MLRYRDHYLSPTMVRIGRGLRYQQQRDCYVGSPEASLRAFSCRVGELWQHAQRSLDVRAWVLHHAIVLEMVVPIQ